jgi:hypothetical protein
VEAVFSAVAAPAAAPATVPLVVAFPEATAFLEKFTIHVLRLLLYRTIHHKIQYQ